MAEGGAGADAPRAARASGRPTRDGSALRSAPRAAPRRRAAGSPRGRGLAAVSGTAAAIGLAALLAAGRPARSATPHGSPPPSAPPDPSPGFDVLGYDLSLTLEAGSDSIAAVQRVRALVTSADLGALRLELRGLTVDSARVAGRAVRPSRAGDTLSLPLPDGLRPEVGDTLVAAVAYRGRPSDGLIARPNVHGDWTVFADDWPDRASHWFASVDHPADKAAVTFRLTLPEGWTSVANGVRTLDAPLPGGGRLQVWREEEAIPVYTMVVGAGRLAVQDGGAARAGPGGTPVPVTYVTFPQDTARGPKLFGATRRILEALARRFGPFPYRKLAMVESATRYGGMENASAIYFPEDGVSGGRVRESTVAHEIAHQWFGDAVTEASWRDLWLSEGFASFGDALWQEASRGEAAYRARMADFERIYLGSDVTGRPVLGPIPDDLTRLLDANAYQKGAWVLYMLRRKVGDAAFFDGLRRYFERYRGRSALTADFRAAMEDASGLDLSGFFRQWLERPGYPEVSVTWAWDADAGALRLRACQEQGGDPYRLELPVRVRAGSAARTVRMTVEDARATLRVPLGSAPDSVAADPLDRILGPVRTGRGDPGAVCPAASGKAAAAGAARGTEAAAGPGPEARPGGRHLR